MTEHDPRDEQPQDSESTPFHIRPADQVRPAGTTPAAAAADAGSTESSAPAVAIAERPRAASGRRMIAFGAAALVLLGIGAGGGALAANGVHQQQTTGAFGQTGTNQSGFGPSGFGQGGSGQSGSGQNSSRQSGAGQGFWHDGSSQSGGFGSGSGFGSGGTSSSGTASSGTRATAAQSAGVVTITTKLGYESASAAGTGIVLSSNGVILTNNHVVEGSTSITVTDETTGRSYTARVVGTDPTHDIAVLRLQHASGLTVAKLASSPAAVGTAVTAVGNAGGTGTLAAARGTVTALKQSITTEAEGSAASEDLTDLIETDADIVSGDSGGPLLNASGQVVGIDTAASSGTRNTTGYAITIARARSIAATILAGTDTADTTIGYPAFLGVEVAGDAGSASAASGATVGGVIDGTPAASAGLTEGDVITAVNGHAIDSATALTTRLHTYAPGDHVRITWTTASGATHTATVTLIAGPAD